MTDQNKDLARRFYDEVVSAGKVEAIDELCAQDFVDHEEGLPGTPDGIEGVRAFVGIMRGAFPDLKASVEDVLEDGDKLAVRVRFTGTHDGDFAGIPASGRKIDMVTIDIVRVVDGKAVEHWGVTDNMALMQQIGAVPAPAPA